MIDLPYATWHAGVDRVAVDRFLSGWLPLSALTAAEQQHVTARLVAGETSASRAAALLGRSERWVVRQREERRKAPL